MQEHRFSRRKPYRLIIKYLNRIGLWTYKRELAYIQERHRAEILRIIIKLAGAWYAIHNISEPVARCVYYAMGIKLTLYNKYKTKGHKPKEALKLAFKGIKGI